MHIRNELSSPVTTWFKYLYKNDITCTDSKSTLALTPLSAMQCIFPSENLQAECPNQCLCSYAPYQSHQDLKGHILVNCSSSQISINETTKLFIPNVRFISYSKCSNRCWLSKLSSNFGCLFTFCYFDGANSIKTDLHIYNSWTGQFVSYKSVIQFFNKFAPAE